ncbi:MAG: apolipoprotein N-acyltransferase [Planctomycetota bacterium]
MLRRPPQLTAHCVALTLTAVLLALSYPLPGWSFLAWVALAPAGWLAATSRRPWTLTWTSTAVFALWWAWMLRWLYPVTLPGALAVAGFQSLFWVLALWATNVCVRRQGVPIAVALPLCWVSLEFVRSMWPWGGFAWFTLAQTQAEFLDQASSDNTPAAIQIGSLLGMPLVSLLIASLSGSTAGLLCKAQHAVRDLMCNVLVVCAVMAITPIGSRMFHASATSESQQALVAVVQTNTPHDNKLSPTAETYEADFAALRRLHVEAATASLPSLREGPGEGARERLELKQPAFETESDTLPQPLPKGGEIGKPALIVWPETVIPGPFNEPAASRIELWALTRPHDDQSATLRARTSKPRQTRELIAEFGVPTMVGSSTEIATDDPRNPEQFNSAHLVIPNGATSEVGRGRYDKMHRVPFGEYIPLPEALKQWVLNTVSPYDFDYSIDAGQGVTVFEVPAGDDRTLRFATPICFEDTNAALCREMVYDPETGEKRVDVLVNLTTNGWFGRLPTEDQPGGLGWESMRYQHLQLASLRAIENRVPVVRSVNTGVSAIIDSTGRIVAAAPPGGEGVLSAELALDDRRTVYAIVGDWPITLLTALTAVWVIVARGRRPKLRRRRAARLAAAG